VPGYIDESSLITAAQARRARDAQAVLALRANLDHVKRHAADLVRERSVWALSLVENGEIVRPLIEKLHDEDWRVRAYAAWALEAAADTRAARSLVDASADPHWRVRMHAMFALKALPIGVAAQDALVRGLEDEEWQVRASAAESLGYAAGSGIRDALLRATRDENMVVRETAEQALHRQAER